MQTTKVVLGILVLALVPAVARSSEPPPAATSIDLQDVGAEVAELYSYLEWFFQGVPRSGSLERAKLLVPDVIEAADAAGVDPLLLAVVVSYESTWRVGVSGAKGEVGLLQVHGRAAEGYDTLTVKGQLAAGAAWLAGHIRNHGLLGGLTAYIGSKERAQRSGKYRYDAYLRELERQGLRLEDRRLPSRR